MPRDPLQDRGSGRSSGVLDVSAARTAPPRAPGGVYRAGPGAGDRAGHHGDLGSHGGAERAVFGAALAVWRGDRSDGYPAAEAGVGSGLSFGFRQQIKEVRSGQIAAGTTINDNELENTQYGTLTTSQLAAVSRQQHVTAVTGVLALTDLTVSGWRAGCMKAQATAPRPSFGTPQAAGGRTLPLGSFRASPACSSCGGMCPGSAAV